jgi:hypothetical protein
MIGLNLQSYYQPFFLLTDLGQNFSGRVGDTTIQD